MAGSERSHPHRLDPMMTRFPVLPFVLAAAVSFVAGGAVYYQNEVRIAALRRALEPAQAAAAPVAAARKTGVTGSRLQEIRSRFAKLGKKGGEQLVALEGLSKDELLGLLKSDELPWEGADVREWKHLLFARYSELDASAALNQAREIFPEDFAFCRAVHPAVLRWAAREPERTAAWWRSLPAFSRSMVSCDDWSQIESALETLVPDAAAGAKVEAAVAALPDGMPGRSPERPAARNAVNEVRKAIAGLRSNVARGRALESLLAKGPAACDMCEASDIAAYWADEDAAEARRWLDKTKDRWPHAATFAPAMALQNVRNNYAGTPDDALDYAQWAHALHPAGCTPEWWEDLVRSNARSRPAVGAKLLQAIPADTDHDPGILAWLETNDSWNAETAGALIRQIQDSAKRSAAEAMVATKLQKATGQ